MHNFNPVVDLKKDRIKYMSGLINATIGLSQLLKEHEYELGTSTKETALIYSSVNNHSYLLGAMFSGAGDQFTKEYAAELQYFSDNRIAKLLAMLVGPISSSMPGNSARSNSESFSNNSLLMLEFDIRNRCKAFEAYRPEKYKDHDIDGSELTDLYSDLSNLSYMFSMMHHRLSGHHNDNNRSGKKYIPDDDDKGCTSLGNMLTVTNLIASVGQAIMIAENRYDEDYTKDRNELDQELIVGLFTKYSNMGQMSMGNIMNCILDVRLFRLAITNPETTLGTYEKLLLRNGLVSVKLLSLLMS